MKTAVFEVIKFSKELGCKGTNAYRTQEYVHSKMSKELGKHSVEFLLDGTALFSK
jgi:hypothetical protein